MTVGRFGLWMGSNDKVAVNSFFFWGGGSQFRPFVFRDVNLLRVRVFFGVGGGGGAAGESCHLCLL